MVSTLVKRYLNSLPQSKEQCGICQNARKEGLKQQQVIEIICGHASGDHCLEDGFMGVRESESHGSCLVCHRLLYKHRLWRRFMRDRFSILVSITLSHVIDVMEVLRWSLQADQASERGTWLSFAVLICWFLIRLDGEIILLRHRKML